METNEKTVKPSMEIYRQVVINPWVSISKEAMDYIMKAMEQAEQDEEKEKSS